MNMKYIIIYLAAISLLLTACSTREKPEEETQQVDTIPIMVMQIQKCSRLYTAEYKVHKIVTHKDEMALKGTMLSKDFNVAIPLGQRNVAIPMDATIKASIDFADFSDKNVHRLGDKIEIILPDPKVELTSSKINHQEVRQRVPLLRSNFTDEELSKLEKQGRASIVKDIPRMGIVEQARQSAANMLILMIEQAGFEQENITITFRKDMDVRELVVGRRA